MYDVRCAMLDVILGLTMHNWLHKVFRVFNFSSVNLCLTIQTVSRAREHRQSNAHRTSHIVHQTFRDEFIVATIILSNSSPSECILLIFSLLL